MNVSTGSLEKGLLIEELINQDLNKKYKSNNFTIRVKYDDIWGDYDLYINDVYLEDFSIDYYIFIDEKYDEENIDDYIFHKQNE